jgi:hypothetical protein
MTPMENLDIALLSISGMGLTQFVGTIWWAASVTKRIEFIEKWISSNEHTAERLVALEQRILSLGEGISRIEHYLRQRH